MGLPAENVQIVPPGEVSACLFCGARPTGHNPEKPDPPLAFIGFDANPDSEAVPAGLIEIVDKRAGQHVYTARDGYGRGSTTVSLELPQVCGDCIEQAGVLLGFEDVTPLQAEADELRAELQRITAEREQALAERDEATDALRATAAIERLLAAAPSKRAKAAA